MNTYHNYWIEARPEGDYLMVLDNGDPTGEAREVSYLGDGSSLADAVRAAVNDISGLAS